MSNDMNIDYSKAFI